MAIRIEQSLADGRKVNYHRIVEAVMDMTTGYGHFVLWSWAEKAHRLGAPMLRRTFGFAQQSGSIYADAYAALKSIPEFSQAEDV